MPNLSRGFGINVSSHCKAVSLQKVKDVHPQKVKEVLQKKVKVDFQPRGANALSDSLSRVARRNGFCNELFYFLKTPNSCVDVYLEKLVPDCIQKLIN